MNWNKDMGIAPDEGGIDIVDKYGDRYVNCYKTYNGWYGIDPAYYEPVAEYIHEPRYWIKVELPEE